MNQIAGKCLGGISLFKPMKASHKAYQVAFEGVLLLVKVNPLQAGRSAQASGIRAKTDTLAARMLARLGAPLSYGRKANWGLKV
jgi:hypothetical protein